MNKLLSFILVFLGLQAFAQNLLRGPYLQINAPTSIVIRWDTDLPTDSRVLYGTDINDLYLTESISDSVLKHEVKLTNLDPNTKYYYSIGDGDTILSDVHAKQHFFTAPVAGSTDPIRVWAIGDFGKGNENQRKVRDSYLNYLGDSLRTNVWLWLGDNAYNDGTEAEYQSKVFDSTYAYHHLFKYMPFWPCPGNHDYKSVCSIPCAQDPVSHTGTYYDIVTVPQQGEAGGVASGYPLYYSFDYGNAHFISLNSEIGSLSDENFDWIGIFFPNGWNNSPMKTWLEQDLDQNDKMWTIAYWHQLPFSKGSHDSDDSWEIYMQAMRENVVPLLESYGVDLIVCGHSHVYERSYMMNGFYGNSNDFDSTQHMLNGLSGNIDSCETYVKRVDKPNGNLGTVYVVSGNGASDTGDPELNHPIMYANDGGDNVCGSVIFEIEGNRLDAFYLKSDSTIGDKFTIIKADSTYEPKICDTETSIINRENSNNFIKVFPHPFTNVANVYYSLDEQSDMTVQLFDMNGKKITTVFEGTLPPGPQNHYIYPNKLGMKKGMYLLSVNDGSKALFKKIVKVE